MRWRRPLEINQSAVAVKTENAASIESWVTICTCSGCRFDNSLLVLEGIVSRHFSLFGGKVGGRNHWLLLRTVEVASSANSVNLKEDKDILLNGVYER